MLLIAGTCARGLSAARLTAGQLHQIGLDLLHRQQHRLAILRQGLLLTRFGSALLGRQRRGVEYRQGQGGPERPGAGVIVIARQLRLVVHQAAHQGQARIAVGRGDADLGIGRHQRLLGGCQVGPLGQQGQRHGRHGKRRGARQLCRQIIEAAAELYFRHARERHQALAQNVAGGLLGQQKTLHFGGRGLGQLGIGRRQDAGRTGALRDAGGVGA